MPKYNYKCSDCKEDFEVYHSMFEPLGECVLCGSKNVAKQLSNFFSVANTKKAGSLVREFIEETKKEVSAEKGKLLDDYHD
jgi:putative FmdB family regulatory protein